MLIKKTDTEAPKLVNIIEELKDGFLTIGPSGNIIYQNFAAVEMLNIENAEKSINFYDDLIRENSHIDLLKKHLEESDYIKDYELEMFTISKSKIPVLLTLTNIKNPSGKVIGFSALIVTFSISYALDDYTILWVVMLPIIIWFVIETERQNQKLLDNSLRAHMKDVSIKEHRKGRLSKEDRDYLKRQYGKEFLSISRPFTGFQSVKFVHPISENQVLNLHLSYKSNHYILHQSKEISHTFLQYDKLLLFHLQS